MLNKQKSSVWPNPQVGFEEVQVDRNSLKPIIIINNANLKVQNQKRPTGHEQMSSNIE
jgi:hypothetical protein